VPETAVYTQLGLEQVRSRLGISINRRLAIVLFFLLLEPSKNAWHLPRIGAFAFQLWNGEVFQIFIFVGIWKERIKTLDLAFQKESAIESSKRNQNIGISGGTFWCWTS
jgi:hypothetical protein